MYKLGEGSYGSVYRAKWVKNDRIVAIKRTKTTHEDEGIPSTTLREISILKNISHPNLVEYTFFIEKTL
jgi:serine/threonine protein kinase